MPFEVQAIRSLQELAALEPEWRSVWDRDPAATPFHSPDWLVPWTEKLWAGGRLLALAIRVDGELVALAPFFLWGYGSDPEVIRVSLLGSGISDYLGMTALPEHSSIAAELVMEQLALLGSEWDVCDLQELRAGCTLLRAGVPRALTVKQTECSVCPVASLPGTAEEYFGRLDAKSRRNLRTAEKRLREAGDCRVQLATPGMERELMERLFDLHAHRWQERGEGGMLASGALREFHLEAASRFGSRGLLRLFGLSLNGRTIAVQYNVAHGRRWYYYLSGFDPEWSRCSPGAVLLMETVRAAFSEGIRELDFLRQSEDFKYDWGGRDQTNWRSQLTRRTETQREVA